MPSTLSEEQISSYRDAFDMFDGDASGSISATELASVMRSLGQNPTEGEISLILDKVDIDRSGTIDFEEFVTLMSPTLTEGKPDLEDEEDDELRAAFRVFDKDGNGTISRSELAEIMKSLGEKLTKDELEQMILEADLDGDGEIDFEEFKKMISGR